MLVSVVVRFRNEAAYLDSVLDALAQQDFPKDQYEVIAVDNVSTDNSRDIALRYTEKLLTIEDYRPGLAINQAVASSSAPYIAVLSAHAIPANRHWLENMFSAMSSSEVAGVYGAQLYPLHSKFLDKRDLDLFSTLEPRTETEDSSFWNANSLFRRSVWESQPFEETVYELEDHYWTKLILPCGYVIRFCPEALVYHYGHIERIDREHLPLSRLEEEKRITAAIQVLDTECAHWPSVMKAGLTLSSLTYVPAIRDAIPSLVRVLRQHPDFDVRWRMAQALGKIRHKEVVPYLIEGLKDSSFFPQDEAAWSLARLGELAVEELIKYVKRGFFQPDEIALVSLALGNSGVKEGEDLAIQILFCELTSGERQRQRNAAYAAGEIVKAPASRELIAPLAHLLANDDETLISTCCWALGCYSQKYSDQVSWREIAHLSSKHCSSLVRFEATVALGKYALGSEKGKDVVTAILEKLYDQDSRVRYGAMQSLRLLAESDMRFAAPDLWDWTDDDFGVMYELALLKDLIGSPPQTRCL